MIDLNEVDESYFDSLFAESKSLVSEGLGCYRIEVEAGDIVNLITRLREAERWKADASQVLNPLFDYAHSLGLAKLGHSVTEALIEDHKRLREAERDAARYRWIREVASGEYEDFDVVTGAAFDAAYGRASNFDLSIDAAMLSAREAAE